MLSQVIDSVWLIHNHVFSTKYFIPLQTTISYYKRERERWSGIQDEHSSNILQNNNKSQSTMRVAA